MGFEDLVKNKFVIFISGLLMASIIYQKIDNAHDPIIEGKVIQESIIPKNISEELRQIHPYWVDLQTKEYGVLRLNFDTSDMSYNNETKKREAGVFIEIGRIGDFEGKAVNLEGRIEIGDRLRVKVDETYGQERTVENIEGIYRYFD